MRCGRLFLITLLLTACGQPLRINPPASRTPVAATQAVRTASPPAGATPTATVGSVVTAVTLPQPSPSIVVILPTAVPQSSQERWLAQQLNRQAIDPPRIYVANAAVPLWWYDPATGQSLEIGSLLGEFPVQAQFTLRNGGRVAFAVPYRINADYGLTAISGAVRERMRAAGYAEQVEAYIIQVEAVVPKE